MRKEAATTYFDTLYRRTVENYGNASHDRRSWGRDSNPGPPECEEGESSYSYGMAVFAKDILCSQKGLPF